MRAYAYAEVRGSSEQGSGRRAAFVILGVVALACAPAFALDGSGSDAPQKIPLKNFSSAQQALRVGLDDLNAGNAQSSVAPLTYAAESGQPLARWKLGEMYADGVGVPRDDLKAYHYFNQLVEDYDEDEPDRRNLSAVAKAFVAVGVYCLNGIPNSDVRPDAQRAHELFQYAATTFGNADAQYNLAHMYIVGAGGLTKDNKVAVHWLALAADRGHRPSQAVLGDLLFNGDGVQNQRGRGLMWLETARANDQDPKDEWIRELARRDWAAASDEDRQAAMMLLDRRSTIKGPTAPAIVTQGSLKSSSVLRPSAVPTLIAAPPAPPLSLPSQ
jgi:uncharacterized protein